MAPDMTHRPPLQARQDPQLVARLVSVRPLPGLRAGSALLRRNGRLLAVQDDAYAAAWIDPASGAIEPVVLRGDGAALPKADKPDFEAALEDAQGVLHLLGSGSLPRRCWIARLAPGAAPELRDLTPLYQALAQAIGGPPNIEGALWLGERVRLCHRAVGEQPDLLLDLPAAVLGGGPASLLGQQALRLGHIDGVPLHLTDACAMPGGGMRFLAAAEQTADAVADGPVAGAALGWLDETGGGWARLQEADGRPSRRKAEGLVVDPDGRGAWLLTDPDDAARPAELCRVVLDGDWTAAHRAQGRPQA